MRRTRPTGGRVHSVATEYRTFKGARPTCTRLREGRPCGRPSDKGSTLGHCAWCRAELRAVGRALGLDRIAHAVMEAPLEDS